MEAAGSLHPALYVQGLARAAAGAGAVLIDRTRVTSIARSGDTFRLTTERGALSARAVLAATNGYTGEATPWLARRLIPVGSYIIATEELPPETMERLFPTKRMISDSRRVLNYFRPIRVSRACSGAGVRASRRPRPNRPRRCCTAS